MGYAGDVTDIQYILNFAILCLKCLQTENYKKMVNMKISKVCRDVRDI